MVLGVWGWGGQVMMSPEYGHARLRTDNGYMDVADAFSLKILSNLRPMTAPPQQEEPVDLVHGCQHVYCLPSSASLFANNVIGGV